MSELKKFVPQMWADGIRDYYNENFILGNLVNRDYEGDASSFGNNIKFVSKEETPEVQDTYVTFTEVDEKTKDFIGCVDRLKYATKTVGDVAMVQKNPIVMSEIIHHMGESLRYAVDEDLYNFFVEHSHEINVDTIYRVSSLDVDVFIDVLKKTFDDAHLPENGRIAFVPSWFVMKCILAGLDVNKSKTSKTGINGYSFSYKGFDFYSSNIVQHSGNTWWKPIFFIENESVSFAEDIIKTEAIRVGDSSTSAVKTTILYGFKDTRPGSIFSIKLCAGSENGTDSEEYRIVPFSEFEDK